MNKFISSYINEQYGIDINNCSEEDLLKVTEIKLSDVTGVQMYGKRERYDWNFSMFPNLRIIDCSYNYIDSIDITKNKFLEEINWSGVRGGLSKPVDLSGNPKLKKLYCGQDSLTELDLSNNIELEAVSVFLNSSLRWINVDKCSNLKRINLSGTGILFVDLTNCRHLEYCDVNYMNTYRNKSGEYGPGYPRPLVFVNEDFNEAIIPRNTREYSYFTYFLIRVLPNSVENDFLESLKSRKREFIDTYNIAIKHYQLLDEFNSLCKEK